MIVVTGAAGFIGSCLVQKLNENQITDLLLVDDFTESKYKNYASKKFENFLQREDFLLWLEGNSEHVEFIFHLGARTDTTLDDEAIFNELNSGYSKKLFSICTEAGIPLLYASSAATYGLGEQGYADDHNTIEKLKPLNKYGVSKQIFDEHVLSAESKPPNWWGLKFFNVYGPNEYHKGRMASVIFHAFNQINEKGGLSLFRSHKDGVEDGEQKRDFIYVKDVIEICYYLFKERPTSGIYNVGSGTASSFNELAECIFNAMAKEKVINYIDTPLDIRDKYQYYTCADLSKLKNTGYPHELTNLKEGVADYVQHYLLKGDHF